MALSSQIDAAVEGSGVGVEALSEPSAELELNSQPQADIVIGDAADEDVVTLRTVRFHVPAGDAYGEGAEFACVDTIPSATVPARTADAARLA